MTATNCDKDARIARNVGKQINAKELEMARAVIAGDQMAERRLKKEIEALWAQTGAVAFLS